jgi:hypothetical protein
MAHCQRLDVAMHHHHVTTPRAASHHFTVPVPGAAGGSLALPWKTNHAYRMPMTCAHSALSSRARHDLGHALSIAFAMVAA